MKRKYQLIVCRMEPFRACC